MIQPISVNNQKYQKVELLVNGIVISINHMEAIQIRNRQIGHATQTNGGNMPRRVFELVTSGSNTLALIPF